MPLLMNALFWPVKGKKVVDNDDRSSLFEGFVEMQMAELVKKACMVKYLHKILKLILS